MLRAVIFNTAAFSAAVLQSIAFDSVAFYSSPLGSTALGSDGNTLRAKATQNGLANKLRAITATVTC
ncbi:hypothetical protein [Paraglaciecola sp. T6c]|uniref:hypothetical protein n=1 Tax=Pseudoalteromonas atlantica (strain T6c / ATCC BAA-1087) TaxID=3042615 RepID=UPI0002E2F684|nr:hypothetical protein [Paraglaciecola sp. T6c]